MPVALVPNASIWMEVINASVHPGSTVMHVQLAVKTTMNVHDYRVEEMHNAETVKAVFNVYVQKVLSAIQWMNVKVYFRLFLI